MSIWADADILTFTPGRAPRPPKICKACKTRPARAAKQGGRPTSYCQLCADADKHGHRTRRDKIKDMLVGVDCESAPVLVNGVTVNRMVTFSYGRADGTSSSLRAAAGGTLEPARAWEWLRDELTGHYTGADGQEYRQRLYGFHFNHDAGMLLAGLWDGLQLVHKATAKERGLLCGRTHTEDEECERYHRFSPDDCRRTLRDGGEEDYIAWDATSKFGFATSPGRRFYMEWRPFGDRFEENKRLDVHDVGNLFPGNFEQVIDLWRPELRPGDREIIVWGKAQRKENFLHVDRDRIAGYSEAECVSLARLLVKFLETLRVTVGVVMRPEKLYGSGSVAAEMMGFHGVPKRKALAVAEQLVAGTRIDDIAQLAYFGGKIEGPVVGVLSEPAYPRDINSAYPSQMVWQPCMREDHGHWTSEAGHVDQSDRTVGYALVSWDFNKIPTAVPPFMVRNKVASVFSPVMGVKTWVTLPEYQAARARWGNRFVVHTHQMVWWTNTCECPPPLAFLSEVYDRRYVEKAKSKDESLPEADRWFAKACEEILKLIINSGYGKLAQRKPQFGAYTNLHAAAMTTGGTRAMLNEEVWSGEALGGTPVYMHTDSVTFVGLEREDQGKALGVWGKEDPKERLFIVQPGIATPLGAGKSATRGVRKATFIPYAKDWACERLGMFLLPPETWETMLPDETRMITLRQAHHLGKPHLAGSFVTKPQKVGFRSGKRDFDGAVPFGKANPYAWRLPPKYLIPTDQVAALEDLESYQIMVRSEIKQGLWDNDKIEV